MKKMKKLYFPIFLSLIITTIILQIINISIINSYHLPSILRSQIFIKNIFFSFIFFLLTFVFELIIKFLPFIVGAIILNFFISEKQIKTKILVGGLILGLINFCQFLGINFAGCIILNFNVPITFLNKSSMTFFFSFLDGYIFALGIGFLTKKKRLFYSIIGLIIFFYCNVFFTSNIGSDIKNALNTFKQGQGWGYFDIYDYLKITIFFIIMAEIGIFCGWLTWLKLDKINSVASFRKKLYKKVGAFVHYIPSDNEDWTIS